VCARVRVYNKKKKNDGRPRTALHNLSYIVKVSYFRVSLSSLALIHSQRHHRCRGGSHTHTAHPHTRIYIIYNTHTHTHTHEYNTYTDIRGDRFTLGFCLYIFKRYLRCVEYASLPRSFIFRTARARARAPPPYLRPPLGRPSPFFFFNALLHPSVYIIGVWVWVGVLVCAYTTCDIRKYIIYTRRAYIYIYTYSVFATAAAAAARRKRSY